LLAALGFGGRPTMVFRLIAESSERLPLRLGHHLLREAVYAMLLILALIGGHRRATKRERDSKYQ
jgi:hypothetical protein